MLLAGCVIVLAIAFLEGSYATQLNHIYYDRFAPFFDSVDYHNQMAIVIETVKQKGFWAGVATNHSTVFLPFFEGALLGLFVQPSRNVGVWLQVLWLAVLGVSIYYYFYQFYIRKLAPALALTLPFMGIAALWRFNGGLSDFRMDLHLYLLGSITFVWFLITRHTPKLYPWVLTGIFAGLTCLSRATAPVYLIVALGPIVVLRLVQADAAARLQLVKRVFLLIGVTLLIAGWFYVTSFERLYYYYVVWNLDANAKLPIQRSIQHFNLAMANMGWFPPVLAAILLPFTVLPLLKQKELPKIFKNLDWEALWVGMAPVAFLVIRGAGLNPFVVMPAVFGFVLFMLKPFKAEHNPLRFLLLPSRSLFILTASISLFVLSALGGIRDHLGHKGLEMGQMAGHQQVIQTMLQDAATSNASQISFAVPYVGMLNPSTIWNVFVYDTAVQPRSVDGGILNRFSNANFFPIAAPSDWKAIPGDTDNQKMNYLVKQVRREADYLIVPTEATIEFSEKNVAGVLLHQYTRALVQRLLKRGWKPLGDQITITSNEQVQVYRRQAS